ncbi:hypothetical protein ACJX0J_029432, partial [Zea mays]
TNDNAAVRVAFLLILYNYERRIRDIKGCKFSIINDINIFAFCFYATISWLFTFFGSHILQCSELFLYLELTTFHLLMPFELETCSTIDHLFRIALTIFIKLYILYERLQ